MQGEVTVNKAGALPQRVRLMLSARMVDAHMAPLTGNQLESKPGCLILKVYTAVLCTAPFRQTTTLYLA